MGGHGLRLGLVGAGTMGRNHLRTAARMKGVEIVGVADSDANAAKYASDQYGCSVFPDLDALAGAADAVVVAAPSSLHAEIAVPLLRSGVHCLVEKPLATTEQDCLSLIAAAKDSGAKLLVGHIERFNPVVEHLMRLLTGSRIYAIDVRRMSSVSGRITDVDVVSDLMVHDLDIVRAIVGSSPVRTRAVGVWEASTTHVDHAVASMIFSQGEIATATSSRITENKIRQYQVLSEVGSITADLLSRELLVHRQSSLRPITVGTSEFTLEVSVDRVFVRDAEPLYVELAHFVDVVNGVAEPRVSGEEALATMRMVWAVQQSLERQ